MRTKKLQRNIGLLYVVSFIGTLIFFHPIYALYIKEQLFTAFNAALVIGVESLAVAFLEIPTGFLTDRFGRKNAIIASLTFYVVTIVLLATSKTLPIFLVFAILHACGAAFSSGTWDAFLFDTLQELDQKKLYKKIQGRISVLSAIAVAIASVIGGLLAYTSLRTPVYATILPVLVALILSFFFIEPRYHKPTGKIRFFSHSLDALRILISRKQLLLMALILVLGVNILGPVSYMRPLFFETNRIPITLFGVFSAIGFGLYAIGSYFSYWFSDQLGNKQTMIFAVFCMIFFVILSTYISGAIAALILIFTSLATGIHNPVESHMLNLEIDSHNRATVLSTINLFKSLLLALSMPLMGWLIDDMGIQGAYRWFSFAAIVTLALLLMIREKNE